MRILAVLAASAAVFASVAIAAPEKGKPPPKTCKAKVTVILKGTVAEAPGSAVTLPFDLQVTVKHSNNHGRAYVTATQPVPVTVTADTKVRRNNKKGLDALKAMAAGDRVQTQSRVCKADLANGATPALTATRVVAHPPESD